MDEDVEIVISGMSGRLPASANMAEFADNLFRGVDMVTENNRWPPGLHGLPTRAGLIKDLRQFDASYFSVHAKQAKVMDPQLRLLLEVTYEAIIDAGMNPGDLRGSRTGVFVGIVHSESEDLWMRDPNNMTGYVQIGCTRSMMANRLSYSFDFRGPSYAVDAACASSLVALQNAFHAIKTGLCDAAVVGGCSLYLRPETGLDFLRLNVLSPDGKCKVFDDNANGYVKSEAVAAVFVQRKKSARRMYATILNARTNTDGAKLQGVTFPSGESQKELILETLEEIAVDPHDVVYMEVHGTGTKAGDPQEVNSIAEVFSTNRMGPLLVGSVKSNIGHTEPASGICSLAKVVIAMEAGEIPANIHYNTPNAAIPGLIDGRLKVIQETTRLPDGLVGLNSFGFGGVNVHVLLEPNPKSRLPARCYNIPRLIIASGRTSSAVSKFLDRAESLPGDTELHALIDSVHSMDIPGHTNRGYVILGNDGQKITGRIREIASAKRPLCFIFSGMGSQCAVANGLMHIPVFRSTVERCDAVLKPFGVPILKMVTDYKDELMQDVVNTCTYITAVQVALTEVLMALGLVPDAFVGHSLGETACAYADGSLTPEQAVLIAHARSLSVKETAKSQCAMAAVGLSWNECIKRCSPGVFTSCDNYSQMVTVSGPENTVADFVYKLTDEGVFAQMIKSCGVAFHSPYILDAAPGFLKRLRDIIPEPQPRSKRWISSSVKNDSDNMFNNPEYHVTNMLSPVLFRQATSKFPENAIVLEVAPSAILQGIIKKNISPMCTTLGFSKRGPDSLVHLITTIGELYAEGVQPQVGSLYEPVSLPVGRGTPMLSPLVEWDHSLEWDLATDKITVDSCGQYEKEIDISTPEYSYLSGNVINGHINFPVAGILVLAWTALAKTLKKNMRELPVSIENVKFTKTVDISVGKIKCTVQILEATGAFTVTVNKTLVARGKIEDTSITANQHGNELKTPAPDCNGDHLNKSDVYMELKLRARDYSGDFQGILKSNVEVTSGELSWIDNEITFIESMLQFNTLSFNSRQLKTVTSIEKVLINPIAMKNLNECVTITKNNLFDVTRAGGVEIYGIKYTGLPLFKCEETAKLDQMTFYPYHNTEIILPELDALTVSLQNAIENNDHTLQKVMEIVFNENEDIYAETIVKIIETESNKRTEVTVASPELTILRNRTPAFIRVKKIDVAVEPTKEKYNLVLCKDVFNKSGRVLLTHIFQSMVADGILISVESRSDWNRLGFERIEIENMTIISTQTTENKVILVIKKTRDEFNKNVVINTNNENFDWVEPLKSALKTAETDAEMRIYVVSNEINNGIIGLTKCLRREPGGSSVRAFYLPEEGKIDLNSEEITKQMKKDIAINIKKSGVWGTYRHLTVPVEDFTIKSEHAVAKIEDGHISWILSPLHYHDNNKNFCRVDYVGLIYGAQKEISCTQFSGRNYQNQRIMGITSSSAIATTAVSEKHFVWNVPENWTLEDASTVPWNYAMAYYALLDRALLLSSMITLIVANDSNMTIAAANVASRYGGAVFVLCESQDLGQALVNFIEVQNVKIGAKGDFAFEETLAKQVVGRGVVILDLSPNENVISPNMMKNVTRYIKLVQCGAKDHGIMFGKRAQLEMIQAEDLLNAKEEVKAEIEILLRNGIESGIVKPLPRMLLRIWNLSDAIVNAAHGSNVILKIRDEEDFLVKDVKPHVYLHPFKTYVVAGGLGGIGMELIQFLIDRGAKKVVISSRSGIKSAYQAYNIKRWRDQEIQVSISTKDFTTLEAAKSILREARDSGPVGGIFNLAGMLLDSFLAKQTVQTFEEVCKPKIQGTLMLDLASRELAPELDHFVVFSSTTSAHGNIGQTNYGYANSAAERICEQRKSLGLPGLAAQFGLIGQVGMVRDFLPGTEQLSGYRLQPVRSCLEALGMFMCMDYPVFCSSLNVSKRISGKEKKGRSELVQVVASIFGVQDASKMPKSAKFADLGIDSIMVREIGSVLNARGLDLSIQDIRSLSVDKLEEMCIESELE